MLMANELALKALQKSRREQENKRKRKRAKMIRDEALSNLKIDGEQVMEVTGEEAGERIGWILDVLLEEVRNDEAGNNVPEYLKKRAWDLAELDDHELRKLSLPKKAKNLWVRVCVERTLQIIGIIGIIYMLYTGKLPWNW